MHKEIGANSQSNNSNFDLISSLLILTVNANGQNILFLAKSRWRWLSKKFKFNAVRNKYDFTIYNISRTQLYFQISRMLILDKKNYYDYISIKKNSSGNKDSFVFQMKEIIDAKNCIQMISI